LPTTPPSRDSSVVAAIVSAQILTSAPTTVTNRGRPPVPFKTQNPIVSSNGRTQEPEITVDAPPTQEDNRRWAHTVASAPAARRTTNDERPNVPFKSSETNVSHLKRQFSSKFLFQKIANPMNNDTLKQKVTSATDIVISLMDTWVKSNHLFFYHQKRKTFLFSVLQKLLVVRQLPIYLLVLVVHEMIQLLPVRH
jgi:hypothetical protein